MIESLNSAMLELQSAYTARSLYPASHPRIRSAEQRAFGLLCEATRAATEVTLFSVGERVVFESDALPASSQLTESLFRRLRESGVDRITFRNGLSEPEVRDLLDALASHDDSLIVKPSIHIRLGFIREAERKAELGSDAPFPTGLPGASDLAHVLDDVWSGVQAENRISPDTLGDVITTLTKMLHDSSTAVLPLAAVKRHDEYTFVHTINVALLSTSLAEAVGFKDRMVHELNMAALLHDLGKQRIPLSLLNKTGRFTDEEFELVQRHPVDGARMLLATPGVPDLAPIVAYEHHVRANGTGYPRVPKGWRLNLASRIVQVADVFDALRTHRPYRPAMPLDKIVALMRQDVGTMFDADLLQIFFENVVSRGIPEAPRIAS